MERTKSIIQYSTSIVILIVCAVLCLLLTFLHLLYGGLDDVLLMLISAFFSLMASEKEKDRRGEVRDIYIKRLSCGIGLFFVSILMGLCFHAVSATINLDVCSCYSWGYIYICQRCTENIKKCSLLLCFLE